MRRTIPSNVAGAAAAGVVFLTAGMQTAYADMFGGDLPLLATLVANSAEGLRRASETVLTLRQTYDEARRVAAYADDARQAYRSFTRYSTGRFAPDSLRLLETAFPDITSLRREASRTGPWARGTGELQAFVSYCFNGLSRGTDAGCIQLQEALSLREAREAISGTFGTVPPVAGSIEVRAVDHEASVAMAASASQFERSKLTRSEADGLLAECRDGNESSNLAACQAAAGTAEIRQLRATADIADQLAEGNRLQAVGLSQQNARRKREINEAAERRQLLLDGTRALGEKPVQVKTEGIDLFSGGR